MELTDINVSEDLLIAVNNHSLDSIIYYEILRNNKGKAEDLIFRYMNDTCFRILKGTREDYIGKTFLSLYPLLINSGLFSSLVKTADTGEPCEFDGEYEAEAYTGWLRINIVKMNGGLIVYFRDITELKNHEINLNNAIRDKDIVLKEIHHRIKNNLQIISSILHLQEQCTTSQEAKNIISDTQNRINAIAFVHQKLHEGRNYVTVDLAAYIKDLVNTIFRMSEAVLLKIRCHTDLDEICCTARNALNLGLIINELVTNAIKYAFPGDKKGTITVSIKDLSQFVVVSVQDDGIGLPEGFNLMKQESIGMQIVHTLADQLDAHLSIESINGTKFILHLNKGFFVKT